MADKNRGILVLQTGGTIDKMYPRKMGAYAFEIGEAATARILSRIGPNFAYKIEKICAKDSQEITGADRENMFQAIRKSQERHVLITHGTDTLCDTAKFLADRGVGLATCSDTRIKSKVVVLTGAFKPESLKETDADFNVGFALGFLRSTQQAGVFVSIGGEVFDGARVTRRQDGAFVEERNITASQ